MSGRLSPRARGLLVLAGAGLVASLAAGRPELAVMATPFLVLLGAGLVLAREPRLHVDMSVARTRILEGERVTASVVVHNRGAATAELEVALARSALVALEPEAPVLLHLPPGSRAEIEMGLRARRWGAHVLGPVVVRARDRLSICSWSLRLGAPVTLRAFPAEERLRELVRPVQTQPFLGAHVARARGDGIEFADVRPFVTGDRVRHVNWRATARRGSLYVTQRHPEQASDVVLLVDTFAEARDEAGGTLDAAVRAAASLARAHLARRDRVALVDFGGTLHWLEPAFGATQLYRIVDALLSSQIAFSYAWRAVESIPARILPARALVVAVTPLLDERSIRLISDLRTRGRDVAIIEVSPLRRTAAGRGDAVAHRLWRLRREALRARLQALGIAVAVWDDDAGLAPALEGVNRFRRSARLGAHA